MSAANYTRLIANQIAFHTGLFNLVVGVFGNVLIIIILTNVRIFRKNQCSFYLIVESCTNLGYLIIIHVYHSPAIALDYDPMKESILWCKIRSAIAQICSLCALFTISCMTIDQYLSTHHRYGFRQKSTLKLAHRLTIFNLCAGMLHGILCIAFYEVRTSAGCSIYQPILKKYYSFIFYPILNGILPLIIIVSMSLLAYRNVYQIIRRQISIIRRRLDRQLTAMVLARVSCLLVLGIPFLFVSLYQLNADLNEQDSMQLAISYLCTRIAAFLLNANFAITFYVFLIISTRFRRQVKHFFIKQCWSSLKSYCCMNKNQIAPTPILQRELISAIESI